MSNVTLKCIANSVGNAGLGVTKSALEVLSKLPVADKPIALLVNRSTANTPSGTFQLLVCDQASNGAVGVFIGAFYFTASKYDPRFLWTQWSKDSLTLFGYKETMTLDEDIYANLRDEIAKMLGNNLHTLVSAIQMH